MTKKKAAAGFICQVKVDTKHIMVLESLPVEIHDYKEKITVIQYILARHINIDKGQNVSESVIEAFVVKIVVSGACSLSMDSSTTGCYQGLILNKYLRPGS